MFDGFHMIGVRTMNAAECNRRAAECAANAALSANEHVSLEFLGLSSQWRALAVRELYLGLSDAEVAASAANTSQGAA
ncbi:MAG: hypothetical protein ACXWKY_10620 [Caulobacteraceae bacterium]